MSQIFSWPNPIPKDSIDYALLLHKGDKAADIFGLNSRMIDSVASSLDSIVEVESKGAVSNFLWGLDTLMVLGCAMLFGLFVVFRPWILPMLRSWMDVNKVFGYMKETGVELRKLFLLLGFMWCYIVSLVLLYSVVDKFGDAYIESRSWYVVYALFFMAVLLARTLDLGVTRSCAWISAEKSQCYAEVKCLDDFWQIFSLVVFCPILMAMMLMNVGVNWLLAVIVIGVSAYLFALYRIFRVNGFARLQWFLYLCTVKILPLAIAVALIV